MVRYSALLLQELLCTCLSVLSKERVGNLDFSAPIIIKLWTLVSDLRHL